MKFLLVAGALVCLAVSSAYFGYALGENSPCSDVEQTDFWKELP